MIQKEFKEIVSSTKKSVLGAIKNHLNPKLVNNIDDVAQEVYIRLYKHIIKKGIDSIRKETLNSFVYVIAKNECLRFNRKYSVESDLASEEQIESTDHQQERIHADMLIDGLSQDLQVVARLHLQGYKQTEIASSLKIPVGTVKSRIYRIKQKLKSIDHE